MAWRRPGDKPLSEPIMVSLLTHICVTRPQWVKINPLSHWGQLTQICACKVTIIGSDNGLSAGQCHAIIWTNAGVLLIVHQASKFSEILFETRIFSLKKMRLKPVVRIMTAILSRPQCIKACTWLYYVLCDSVEIWYRFVLFMIVVSVVL